MKKIVLALFSLSLTTAQAVIQLTIPQAIERAKKHRPNLQALEYKIMEEKLKVKQAWSGYLPQIQISGGIENSNCSLVISSDNTSASPQAMAYASTNITAKQLIYQFGGPQQQASIARAGVAVAQYDKATQEAALTYEVTKTCIDSWVIQQQQRFFRQLDRSSKRTFNKAEQEHALEMVDTQDYYGYIETRALANEEVEGSKENAALVEAQLAFLLGDKEAVNLIDAEKGEVTLIAFTPAGPLEIEEDNKLGPRFPGFAKPFDPSTTLRSKLLDLTVSRRAFRFERSRELRTKGVPAHPEEEPFDKLRMNFATSRGTPDTSQQLPVGGIAKGDDGRKGDNVENKIVCKKAVIPASEPGSCAIEIQDPGSEAGMTNNFTLNSNQKKPHSLSFFLATAQRNRPELKQINHRIDMEQQTAKQARLSNGPSLGLRGSANSNNSIPPCQQGTYSVGLYLDWPVFDGNLSHYKQQAADARAMAAILDKEQLVKQINLDVELAYRMVKRSTLTYKAQQIAITRATSLFARRKKEFNLGMITKTALEEGRYGLLQAKNKWILAQADYAQKHANLLYRCGEMTV